MLWRLVSWLGVLQQHASGRGSTFEGSNLAILIFDLALNPVRGMDAPAAAATGIIPADLKTVGDEVFLLASFSGVGDATFGPNTLTAPGVLLASIDPATTSWNWGQLPSTVGASGYSMTPYNSGGVPQMLVSGRFSGGTLFWDGESYPNANGIAGYVANVRAQGKPTGGSTRTVPDEPAGDA